MKFQSLLLNQEINLSDFSNLDQNSDNESDQSSRILDNQGKYSFSNRKFDLQKSSFFQTEEVFAEKENQQNGSDKKLIEMISENSGINLLCPNPESLNLIIEKQIEAGRKESKKIT